MGALLIDRLRHRSIIGIDPCIVIWLALLIDRSIDRAC
jgi:hypothetical protein